MENPIIIKNQIFDISKIEHIMFDYESSAINAYCINMHITLNCGLHIKISSKDYTEIIVKIMVYLKLFVQEGKNIFSNKEIFYELFKKSGIKVDVAQEIFTYYYSKIQKSFQLA